MILSQSEQDDGSRWDRAVPLSYDGKYQNGRPPHADRYRPTIEDGPQEQVGVHSQSHSPMFDNPTHNHITTNDDREYLTENNSDPSTSVVQKSAWIYRDKLARIESREMEELTKSLSPSSARSLSPVMSSHKTESWRRKGSSDVLRDHGSPTKAKLSSSPTNDHQTYGYVDGGVVEANGFDNVNVDHAGTAHRQHKRILSNGKINTSRIPVSRNSPAPVPTSYIERDSPVPRSRNGSIQLSTMDDGLEITKSRARSASLGSQLALNRPVSMQSESTPAPRSDNHLDRSPTHMDARSVSPISIMANEPPLQQAEARIVPVIDVPTRYRGPSGPLIKPIGSETIPRTRAVDAPEGPPPWLAMTFRPDPRLPPEQQIVPAHALALRREQWTKEGKTGGIYDQNLNLIEAYPPDLPLAIEKPAPVSKHLSENHHQDETALPIKNGLAATTIYLKHEGPETIEQINQSSPVLDSNVRLDRAQLSRKHSAFDDDESDDADDDNNNPIDSITNVIGPTVPDKENANYTQESRTTNPSQRDVHTINPSRISNARGGFDIDEEEETIGKKGQGCRCCVVM